MNRKKQVNIIKKFYNYPTNKTCYGDKHFPKIIAKNGKFSGYSNVILWFLKQEFASKGCL